MVETPCAFLVAFAVAVGCGLQPFGNANPSPMADFLVGYQTPLGREYLANLVTGLLVEVMTNSISANKRHKQPLYGCRGRPVQRIGNPRIFGLL